MENTKLWHFKLETSNGKCKHGHSLILNNYSVQHFATYLVLETIPICNNEHYSKLMFKCSGISSGKASCNRNIKAESAFVCQVPQVVKKKHIVYSIAPNTAFSEKRQYFLFGNTWMIGTVLCIYIYVIYYYWNLRNSRLMRWTEMDQCRYMLLKITATPEEKVKISMWFSAIHSSILSWSLDWFST